MNERVYIKNELTEIFRSMGCGIVDYVDIYKIEGDKIYFKAGNGKFHMTQKELKENVLGEG